MKLHINPISPPARMTAAVATYLEIPFEKVIVDLRAGEHMTPEYEKLNPMKQVPLLQDGDLNLSESFAICRYLATSTPNGEKIYPNDPKKRALIDMHLSTINDIRMAGARLVAGTIRAERLGQPVMHDFVQGFLKDMLNKGIAEYNNHLADKEFVILDQPTLADFALSYIVIASAILRIDMEKEAPNVFKYFNNLKDKFPLLKEEDEKFQSILKESAPEKK